MWVSSSIRAVLLGLLGAVSLVACSASDTGSATPRSEPRGSLWSADSGAAGESGESIRFGDGRALSAHYSPVADRLVVLTTVGLAVYEGWGGSSMLLERSSREDVHSALSPNGEFLALVDGTDPQLEVWNLSDGERLFTAPVGDLPGVVHSVTFGVDSSLVTVSTTESVVRWSLEGERSLLIGPPEVGALGPAAISTTGGQVVAAVAGAATPAIVVWNASAGSRSFDLDLGPDEQLGGTALSSDGSLVVVELVSAAGSDQNSLAVVDPATGVLRDHRIGVGALTTSMWAVGPGDRLMFVQPTTVSIFDIDGAVVGGGDVANDAAPISVSAPSDGDTFVTAHEDGSLVVWGLGGERLSMVSPTAGVLREVIRPNGSYVVTVGFSGLVDGWVVPEGESVGLIDRFSMGAVNSVAISSSGDQVAVAHAGGRVDLTDSQTGVVAVQLDHDGRNVDAVAYSPNSSRLVTGIGERLGLEAFDDTVTVWDARTGNAEREIGGEGENVAGCSTFRNLVRYSPDGKLIAASSHNFTVTLYEADGLSPVLTLPPHGNTILDITFSSDGKMLATSSEDLMLRIWDVASGDLIAEHEAALGGYWAIAFAPDGASLATIGATGSVNLVGVADGQVVQAFDDAANWQSNVTFSRDGSLLATGGKEDEVLVWKTSDGTVVDRLVGHADLVNAVAVSADDSYLLSGSEDGTARRWSLES